MKRVMAFGTFDHFHAGHESYLKQAKTLGDFLVVVVARDETVKKIKGKSPDYSESQRAEIIRKTGMADKVVIGEQNDKYTVIRKHKPHAIALGYDQFTFTFQLKKFLIDHKMDTKVVRMKPYKPAVYKTSILKASGLVPQLQI